jgi:hypothetical protein
MSFLACSPRDKPNGGNAFIASPLEESAKRGSIPMGANLNKLLPFRFIDLDPLDTAFFSVSFIFTYKPDIPVLFPLPLEEAAASTSLYAISQLAV